MKKINPGAAPLIADMLREITTNVLNVLAKDKIDNPYLKATLAPFINTFIDGILEGFSSDIMAKNLGKKTVLSKDKMRSENEVASLLPEEVQTVEDMSHFFDAVTMGLEEEGAS